MSKPKLSMALSHYDRHIPFFDGSVQLEDFDLDVNGDADSKTTYENSINTLKLIMQNL